MSKGLYVHIPFCKTFCSYCDFPKIIAKDEFKDKYVDRLIEELNTKKEQLVDVDTVFIGGGTPNNLNLSQLKRLLEALKPYLDKSVESSIELNVELITEDLVELLSKYNINRVSLGVQTLKEESLKLINRHHNWLDLFNACKLLTKYNLCNINVDLMFGIPYTSIEDVKFDLDFVLTLPITHLSYYSLIVEDKTNLNYKIKKGIIKCLDDDLIADMYDYIKARLKEAGFNHYEISNFAKAGFESKHNLKYWSLDEYIGIGASSASLINNERIYNSNIKDYFNKFTDYIDKLSINDLKNEFFMLGFRKVNGVSIKEYIKRFNSNPLEEFNFKKLLDEDLIEINGDIIKVKEDKLFIANNVFMEFIGD